MATFEGVTQLRRVGSDVAWLSQSPKFGNFEIALRVENSRLSISLNGEVSTVYLPGDGVDDIVKLFLRDQADVEKMWAQVRAERQRTRVAVAPKVAPDWVPDGALEEVKESMERNACVLWLDGDEFAFAECSSQEELDMASWLADLLEP